MVCSNKVLTWAKEGSKAKKKPGDVIYEYPLDIKSKINNDNNKTNLTVKQLIYPQQGMKSNENIVMPMIDSRVNHSTK